MSNVYVMVLIKLRIAIMLCHPPLQKNIFGTAFSLLVVKIEEVLTTGSCPTLVVK
jgi:hypothetical protein